MCGQIVLRFILSKHPFWFERNVNLQNAAVGSDPVRGGRSGRDIHRERDRAGPQRSKTPAYRATTRRNAACPYWTNPAVASSLKTVERTLSWVASCFQIYFYKRAQRR